MTPVALGGALDAGQWLEVLIAVGVLSTISEAARWVMRRRKDGVDAAAVIQGAALSMLEPLHKELDLANGQINDLRNRLQQLSADLDAALRRAESAETVLMANGLPIPARGPIQG
jgi:hypothetical protein